jgi:heme A synthase
VKRFRGLAVVAAVAVYLQVVLGSVVRITGSGLGCPDWPLCHGQVVPSFEYHTVIEYAHRLVGTTAGLLMVATAVYAVVLHRRNQVPRGLMPASIVAVGLIVVQGIVGGITVLMKNSPFTVAIHLGNAELVLGAAIVVALWATRVARGVARPRGRAGNARIIAGLLGAYVILVTGAVLVGTGASGACTSWPLCGQSRTSLADVHMLHRVVVLLGSVAVLAAAFTGQRRWRGQGLALAAWAAAVLLLAEVLVGAAQVTNGLPAPLRSIHVALASAVWGAMVLLAGGAWLEREGRREQAATNPARLARAGVNT